MLERPINNSLEQGKEKPSIKEGVDFVFEQNPELASIGTKEEYSEYLESIFPESKIKDILFHQTDSDWFKDEDFKKEKMGKTDYGYYGKGFYFSSIKDHVGGYGEKTFSVILNIKNPKYEVDTHTVFKQILCGMDKKESKDIASTWLIENMKSNDLEKQKLESGIIYKHRDIPLGVDFEEYWQQKIKDGIIYYEEMNKLLLNQLQDIDSIIDEYYSYDGFLTSNEEDDFSYYSEIMVRNPEQIRILGSKKDINGFKNFVESRK